MKPTTIFASIVGVVLVAAIAVFSFLSKASSQTTATTTTTPDATEELTTAPSNVATSSNVDTTSGATANTSGYKDGTYTASGSYRTPETTETINVTLTLKDGVVTDSSISFASSREPESKQYQAQFSAGYKQYVVGKNINDVQVSRVSGSSLTSNGFNAALEKIKTQAQA